MIKDMIFGIVGGLGLFLFGMSLMSDGLKKVAGQKLRNILESLTKHRIVAVLVGTLVTGMIQSSSATTVMVIGFVNAGLLTLKQALCVVLGANVGTTFTAWLVSAFGIGGLKITAYALPAIGLGFLMQIVGKSIRMKSIGNILLGFGLLFVGISFMKDAFDLIKSSAEVQNALIWMGRNPLLAILAGTIITMFLQSSSASIMIIQVLAFQGAFGTDYSLALRVTIPFIMGDNIGTTITAQLAALRASRNSKRTAMGHTIFNVIGVLYMLPLVWNGAYGNMVEWITPFKLTQSTIMIHMAVAHSMFNVFNAIVFLPFIKGLEGLVLKLLPFHEEELEEKPVILEKNLLATPVIALDQARREIVRMAQRARKAVQQAFKGLFEEDAKKIAKAKDSENKVDEFQHEITSYLVKLSREQLSDQVSIELPTLLHTVNDFERIGDHAVNIAEIAERKIEHKVKFSQEAQTELDEMLIQLYQMFEKIIFSLAEKNIEYAQKSFANENQLNFMQIELRRQHVRRMSEGNCSARAGLIFIDLVDNIEKIGDHLTNIAQSVIGGLQWDGVDIKKMPA